MAHFLFIEHRRTPHPGADGGSPVQTAPVTPLAVAQARRALLDTGAPLRLRRMAWLTAKSAFGHPVTQSRFLLLFGRA